MNHVPPVILLLTDSPYFRRYLRATFEQAAWQCREWDPRAGDLEPGESAYSGLTAAVAEWRLGESQVSGLQILSAIRKRSDLVACVLYAVEAGEDAWRVASAEASAQGILALRHGSVAPDLLYQAVVEEVRRWRGDFREPRQGWEDAEGWIRPASETPEPNLVHAVEEVGRRHLLPIIKGLFPERGPQNPIRYSFLSPGFSGARVFLLQDPLGTERTGPRYILKVARGDEGYRALGEERRRFHRYIETGQPGQRLQGYVAAELRPAPEQRDLVEANDWFGIAYREVGNGTGKVVSWRDLYLRKPEVGQEAARYRRLGNFLDRLFTDCLGRSCHHQAQAVNRRLWGDGSKMDACYALPPRRQSTIFAALDELQLRAVSLLEGGGDVETKIMRVTAFIEHGRCSRLSEPTLFHRDFLVLAAGTHGDLHAGNILAIDRQGDIDPFLIDFSEYEERGHPFYDYARLENDVRMRLMNYEDGSDVVDSLLGDWMSREERLQLLLEDLRPGDEEPPVQPGSQGLAAKGYWLMGRIRRLAHQNLRLRLADPRMQPSRESFCVQYMAALLHRTLISLGSTDIVAEKKVLGLQLASDLIARLGATVDGMPG